MGFFKFLVSKPHIIFLVVFILVLVVYTILSIVNAVDTAKIQAVFSTPIGEAPFGWLAMLVWLVACLGRK